MIRLFDVQAGFGGARAGQREVVAAQDLAAELVRLSIDGALVRIEPEDMETDVELCNAKLYEACGGNPPLIPCPVVLPASAGDVPPEPEQVDAAVRRGAGAVFLRPARDAWILDDWVCGPLFRALEARRVPAFCLERLIGPEQVAKLAGRYPDVSFLLAGGNYRGQRVYVPLLETFPNVFLSTGNNNCVYRGIEQIVERVGPGRLLFGTGFPAAEPMAAVTQLTYSEIPEEAKALIGAGNVERLIARIVR